MASVGLRSFPHDVPPRPPPPHQPSQGALKSAYRVAPKPTQGRPSSSGRNQAPPDSSLAFMELSRSTRPPASRHAHSPTGLTSRPTPTSSRIPTALCLFCLLFAQLKGVQEYNINDNATFPLMEEPIKPGRPTPIMETTARSNSHLSQPPQNARRPASMTRPEAMSSPRINACKKGYPSP